MLFNFQEIKMFVIKSNYNGKTVIHILKARRNVREYLKKELSEDVEIFQL